MLICRAAADTALPQAQIFDPSSAPPKVEQTAQFLRGELSRLFVTGEVTSSAYSPAIVFEDPISRFTDLNGYSLMIHALKTLFNVTFTLHSVDVTAPDSITTRWTMALKVWELPWRPTVLISGRSYYKIDPASGLITSHKDTWDAVDNNSFPSPEAVGELVRQVLDLSQTPDLETPSYSVLRVTRDYEIRRYDPYVVAEVPMGSGSSPAGGAGFNELANYTIFGNNSEGVKMEMTTPVFSAPSTQPRSSNMQFVLERKLGGVEDLPEPLDPRITRKQQGGGEVAVLRFGGIPLDFEVTAAERRLRDALLRDGLQPQPGYRLARWNEPFVLPPFRRNEVMIDLKDFTWT